MSNAGTWRDLYVGVNPMYDDPEWADGATDQPGDPGEPISTRLEGPYGLPYFDGVEDPNAITGLYASPDPLPWSPNEDVGGQAVVGVFEGAYRTLGPVYAWGDEPSGGMVDTPQGILLGDQAIGRLMRFPANIPDRYDPNGVYTGNDYRDELAALIANGNAPIVSNAEVTTQLTLWPNVSQY